MDEKTKEAVKSSVRSVEDVLQRLNCEVFDENRDAQVCQYQNKSIQSAIEWSDQIVVVLTSFTYIEDSWSVLKLHKSFEKTVEKSTTSKLLFVVGPGMKKAIKDASATNETSNLLHRAIKTNHVVEWTKERANSSRFRCEIELAVPKFRQEVVSPVALRTCRKLEGHKESMMPAVVEL